MSFAETEETAMKLHYVALSIAVAAGLATAPVNAGLLGGVSGAGSFGGTAAGSFGRHRDLTGSVTGNGSDAVEVAQPKAPHLGLAKKAKGATSEAVGETGTVSNSAAAKAGRSTELTGTVAGQADAAANPRHVAGTAGGSGALDLTRNEPGPSAAPTATSAKPNGTTPTSKPSPATKPAPVTTGAAGSTTASESTSPPPSVSASGSASGNGSVSANR